MFLRREFTRIPNLVFTFGIYRDSNLNLHREFIRFFFKKTERKNLNEVKNTVN